MKPTKLSIALLLLVAISTWMCIGPLRFTWEEASYRLTDVKIRLVQNLLKDTVILTPYQVEYNLEGVSQPLLSVENRLDSGKSMGILIKLWGKVVTPKGYGFYGPYPKRGLESKIDSMKILISNGDYSIDLKEYMNGDSILTNREIKWINLNLFDQSFNKGYSSGKTIFLNNIDSFKRFLNSPDKHAELRCRIVDLDYLFWLDESIYSKLEKEYNSCKIELFLSDSLGNSTHIQDSINIHYR